MYDLSLVLSSSDSHKRYTKSRSPLITQTVIYHFIPSLLISLLSHQTAQNSAVHVGSRTVIV